MIALFLLQHHVYSIELCCYQTGRKVVVEREVVWRPFGNPSADLGGRINAVHIILHCLSSELRSIRQANSLYT
jgi:hypothetical protein